MSDNKRISATQHRLRQITHKAVKDAYAAIDALSDDDLAELERAAKADVEQCPGLCETDFVAAVVDIVRRQREQQEVSR